MDEDSRGQVCDLCRRLHEIHEIPVTSRAFKQVHLHRNNWFYDFLLHICRFLHEELLPSDSHGPRTFRDFIRDEREMRFLFEAFVRNFYKRHLPICTVRREDIDWRWKASTDHKQWLPKMQTDVTVDFPDGRKAIIDCKFTAKLLQAWRGDPKLISDHLYQVHAYITQVKHAPSLCRIVLLYPVAGNPIEPLDYTDGEGRTISIRTVDLNQHWHKIHDELLDILLKR